MAKNPSVDLARSDSYRSIWPRLVSPRDVVSWNRVDVLDLEISPSICRIEAIWQADSVIWRNSRAPWWPNPWNGRLWQELGTLHFYPGWLRARNACRWCAYKMILRACTGRTSKRRLFRIAGIRAVWCWSVFGCGRVDWICRRRLYCIWCIWTASHLITKEIYEESDLNLYFQIPRNIWKKK